VLGEDVRCRGHRYSDRWGIHRRRSLLNRLLEGRGGPFAFAGLVVVRRRAANAPRPNASRPTSIASNLRAPRVSITMPLIVTNASGPEAIRPLE